MVPPGVVGVVIALLVCRAWVNVLQHVRLTHVEDRLADLFPTPPGYPYRRGKVTTAVSPRKDAA